MKLNQEVFGSNNGVNTLATANDYAMIPQSDIARYGDDVFRDAMHLNNLLWPNERHIACAICLDTSGSMHTDNAIGKLMEGLSAFKNQTLNDPSVDEHTKSCIDVALITFGDDKVEVKQGFKPVSEMSVPLLTASGSTPMGSAINIALDLITEQKAKYNNFGTPYFRPWLFCITDGLPNDDYITAARRLHDMEDAAKVLGYCVGVDNFDVETMKTIFSPKRIFELRNHNFPAMFEFLSSSLVTIRNSTVGGKFDVVAPADLHTISIES